MQCVYTLSNDQRLVFSKLAFYLEGKDRLEYIVSVPSSFILRFFSRIRLSERFARCGVRCCGRLSPNRFVVALLHKVWLLDIENKHLTMIQRAAPGFSDPLNFCSNGRAVIWADYGNNPDRKAVNIYRLDESQTVEIVYSFPTGTVRHVHNIIWSAATNVFYVLTGDLEEKSGIYLATHDWSEVIPVVIGQQQYRAVTAFPFKNGLIYATDAVEEENRIYLLLDGSVKPLCQFPGSCIYGVETREYFVFSSSVEPPEGRGIWDLFSYKLGPGIQDRYAHLIAVRKRDLQVREILKVKKDIWPMKLFQYGTIMFPNGQEMNDKIWYYIVACKGDGETKELLL